MANRRGHLFAALTALGMTCSLAGHAQTAPRPWPRIRQPPLAGKRELLLGVSLNGAAQPGSERIIALSNGRLAATADAIQHWRLRVPAIQPIPFGGDNFYPLDAIPELHYTVDSAAQQLKITIPPRNFLSSTLTGQSGLLAPPSVSPGAFFNYDVLAQRDRISQTDTFIPTQSDRTSNGLFEGGLFSSWGVGTTTFLWQNPIPAGTGRHLTRLDSAWTYEDPASMSRFQLGDNITSTGTWGRAVRFGGLQWRRDFNTQPGFITFPQPSLTGIAAVPSTVDVYVNNSRRSSTGVPVGPFQLNNVPVITGTGDVKLVVTDLLGRQQVITEHYYASQSLLRKGLSDYSFEGGGVRADYSLLSNHYGQAFGEATYRYGLSDSFTAELRAEGLSTERTAGLGGVYVWPAVGTLTAAVAGSREQDGSGRMAMAGVEHIGQNVTWSAQELAATERFTELGWVIGPPGAPGVTAATALTGLPNLPLATAPASYRPRRIQSVLLGVPAPGLGGTLSLSGVNQTFYGQSGTNVVSLNYSRELPGSFFFTVYGSRSRSTGTTPSFFAGFMLSKALGSDTSASLQTNRQNAGNDHILQVQKNLPAGSGTGYLLMADQGLNKRQEADGYWQTGVGTFTAGVSHSANITSTRVGATGGVALLGGSAFLTRYIYNSFAVADAGGYPNVRVYYENRLVGRTDSNGQLLIPQLLPYQPNRISVNPSDLPIQAQIATPEVLVTPALRSGAYVKFPVTTVHGGTLTIVLEDGSYFPVGGHIVMLNQRDEYPVGREGKVFLPDLGPTNKLFAVWHHQACELTVDLPPNSPPLADLGKLVCKGVKR